MEEAEVEQEEEEEEGKDGGRLILGGGRGAAEGFVKEREGLGGTGGGERRGEEGQQQK